MNEEGLIVGCDSTLEVLLPWWWKHYSSHNSYPVAFVDFGMSKEALAWCEARGICIPMQDFDDSFLSTKEEVSPQLREKWETFYGKGFWPYRPVFFKKPFALLKSPFVRTIWLDLDCQVRGPLDPLFTCLAFGIELAIAREPLHNQKTEQELGLLLPGEISYNSGVLVFQSKAKILEKWVDLAVKDNKQFLGDQNALSRAIYTQRPSFLELPPIYNWSRTLGNNPNALIHHFHGAIGKSQILKNIQEEMMLLEK
jgi:hypothetical protein